MSNQLPVRRNAGWLATLKGGDQTHKAAAAIQQDAFLARSRRSAERDLALLELGDVEALAVRGIAGAGNVAGYAAAEVEHNPLAAAGVSRVLTTTNAGLDRVLRGYIDRSQG
jgi:hypothetical protein